MAAPSELYRQIVENIPNMIVFLYEDDPLRYTFVGGQGLETVTLNKEDLEGNPVADGRPPEIRETVRSHYRQALDGDEVEFEFEGEGRHFRFHLTPVTDDDGSIKCGAGIAQDITEQRVTEQELRRKNQQLEEFTELLAHDLRNPLNVIEGHLEMLKTECDSESIEPIENALGRIESLADPDAISTTSVPNDAVSPIAFREVAERAWQNVATKDTDLEVATDRVVDADASDLQRLFENLYRNAVEHGGENVTVRVGEFADGIYIADTGTGIPEGERETVFEQGYSSHSDGAGLGLFIVQRVVDEHGWEITATESDEGGARFEIAINEAAEPT